MSPYRRFLVTLTLAALTPVVMAENKPSFTLGGGVPSDVYIYIHGAYNPEKEYLDKYWKDVWTSFKKTGIIEDVHTLISSTAPPADREKFDSFWRRAGELINGVDWDARIDELVYTSRMGIPMPEYLLLLRYESDAKAAKNGEAFAAVLKEIESVAGTADGRFTCDEQQVHGATVKSLKARDVPFASLRVAVRGPVVAVAIDRTLLDESLGLLAGQADKKGLTQTERYTQAMAKLPPAEDTVVFFDVKTMIEGVRGIMKFGGEQAPQDEKAKEVLGVVNKVLDEVGVLDYLASTEHTEGYQQHDETIVMLAPDAPKSRLYKVFCKPEPIERFDRFIPKEATAYSVTSGIDLAALYGVVIDFIGKEVPEGDSVLAKWEQAQNEIGFRPERDVFSWLGHQMVSVTLPAAAPSPFSSEDSVLFIKVRNEKQASEKIKAGLDKLNQLLTRANQPLTSQPAEVVGAQGFRMVTHPMVAMFLHPVYGTAEEHLVIGSSSEAIQTCLATARGEHPSVIKNERVTREGLVPKGAVTSADFADMTNMGRDVAQVLGVMGMVSAMIPDRPDTKPIRGIFGMVSKLGPVAMKLNFFVSQSSATTFEKNAWHIRKVINYREPKPTTAESAALSER
ncbi:MAG: hypothetical protein KA354_02905 [Phycisphaerae bacterium]|nr:hypothetical protein [Phycisphaerae bacterium]